MTTPTPPKRHYTRRTEKQWQSIIEEYNASTLTPKAFCEKHSIAISGFYLWRKRFDDAASPPGVSPFIEISPPSDTPTSVFSDPHKPDWDVELVLGHNITLRIRAS